MYKLRRLVGRARGISAGGEPVRRRREREGVVSREKE